MAKPYDLSNVPVDDVSTKIKELESLGIQIVDDLSEELKLLARKRSMGRVDGIERHYNSKVRFSYKRSGNHVYFYLTKFIVSSSGLDSGTVISKHFPKRKTYPFITDAQIMNKAKEWEHSYLLNARDILADIVQAINDLKASQRYAGLASKKLYVLSEKAILQSECPIYRSYISHAD